MIRTVQEWYGKMILLCDIATHRVRTQGTPAFMCINALPAILSRYEPYSHFFGHDVESLIYVALYCGLYRLPWKDYSEAHHQYFLRTVFDFESGRGWKAILVTEYDERGSIFQNSEFHEWLMAALNLISMWYPTPASLLLLRLSAQNFRPLLKWTRRHWRNVTLSLARCLFAGVSHSKLQTLLLALISRHCRLSGSNIIQVTQPCS